MDPVVVDLTGDSDDDVVVPPAAVVKTMQKELHNNRKQEEEELSSSTNNKDKEAGAATMPINNKLSSEESSTISPGKEEDQKKSDVDADEQYDSNDDQKMPSSLSTTNGGEPMEFQFPKPSYGFANKLRFARLCQKLENLDKAQNQRRKTKKKKMTTEQKLAKLLPKEGFQQLGNGSSPFPLFRLIMPNKDTSRFPYTKEPSLATAYAAVLGIEGTPKHDALKHYNNPHFMEKAGFRKTPRSGDFSTIIECILKESVNYPASMATIGQINKALDQLAAGAGKQGGGQQQSQSQRQQWSQHNFYHNNSQQQQRHGSSQTTTTTTNNNNKKKRMTDAQVKKQFVNVLVNVLKLSPIEHKWIVRILLEDMKVGLGHVAILEHWIPIHANSEMRSTNSLKAVCDRLCFPAHVQQLEEQIRQKEMEQKKRRFQQLYSDYYRGVGGGRHSSTNHIRDEIRLGGILSPMMSYRTSFEACLAHMGKAHKEVRMGLPPNDPARESLALKFPAFSVEVKMDGERMLVHIHRGIVTMQTRRGKWFSPLYSPAVGPALRRAIAKYDIDVILDGEMLAWDNNRGQVVEFGQNRPVAIARQNWLRTHGQLDSRDVGLHEGENDAWVMRFDEAARMNFVGQRTINPQGTRGGDYRWIKFVAFDILHVGGPDAEKAIADSLSLSAASKIGPVADMTGFERKQILYSLIEEQENEVEIVEAVVVRPNGDCARGQDYFSLSNPIMECSLPAKVLDSAKWTLEVGHPSLKKIDDSRCQSRPDMEISKRRTTFVNNLYHSIVNQRKQEGLVFKDLAAPYILGQNKGLWRKIKPDYSRSSFASDIDVVIVGASYSVGANCSGQIGNFLCACADSTEPGKFLTVAKIDARSMCGRRQEIMKQTGFVMGRNGKLGKWFVEEDHGTSLPSFFSERSLQFGRESFDGWKFDKRENYPDLFIHPQDSVVVAVNAAEIIESGEFAAGVTLRFPRITRARLGADAKDPEDVEDEQMLEDMLQQHRSERLKFETTDTSCEISDTAGEFCKFLTAEQHDVRQKRRKAKSSGVVKRVRVEGKQSNALLGMNFLVVEGPYSFDANSPDAQQAPAEGWLEDATMIHDSSDVATFIIKHGGQCFRSADSDTIVIGATWDLKVNLIAQQLDKKKKKGTEDQPNAAGILKWTYVLSLVKRWENVVNHRLKNLDGYSSDEYEPGDFQQNDESILTTLPSMMKPRFFDFLHKKGDSPLPSILRHGKLDNTSMRQALSLLQEVKEAKPATTKKPRMELDNAPWQSNALHCLSPENRWILSGGCEKLWPYGDCSARLAAFGPASETKQPVVVYADLFGEDFGRANNHCPAGQELDSAERWQQASSIMKLSPMASSLPLLRCMGSRVTFHLTEQVTHVLCNLAGTMASVPWHPGEALDVFEDSDHGRMLQERLEQTVGHPVLLITNSWVNTTFDM